MEELEACNSDDSKISSKMGEILFMEFQETKWGTVAPHQEDVNIPEM